VLVLLAAVVLALATWLYLSDAAGVPVWRSYISVVVTELLALATLTRNANWAAALRGLTGGWLMAAPYLLKFEDIAAAQWTYLAIGTLVAALAVPGITTLRAGRVRIAV
jgi:hypothetical protein